MSDTGAPYQVSSARRVAGYGDWVDGVPRSPEEQLRQARLVVASGATRGWSLRARAARAQVRDLVGGALTTGGAADPDLAALAARLYLNARAWRRANAVVRAGLAAHPGHPGLLVARAYVVEKPVDQIGPALAALAAAPHHPEAARLVHELSRWTVDSLAFALRHLALGLAAAVVVQLSDRTDAPPLVALIFAWRGVLPGINGLRALARLPRASLSAALRTGPRRSAGPLLVTATLLLAGVIVVFAAAPVGRGATPWALGTAVGVGAAALAVAAAGAAHAATQVDDGAAEGRYRPTGPGARALRDDVRLSVLVTLVVALIGVLAVAVTVPDVLATTTPAAALTEAWPPLAVIAVLGVLRATDLARTRAAARVLGWRVLRLWGPVG